ncbi:NUDIX hydrolase [Erythrobacter sp. EC-HK427]|uniref:NUDIX hydrolase n=1 Tax=Erythrobacter sp. EC-HK427 TaxID=2038396 RepID=UPI001257FD4D|nr:NUDIX domain-containing protein [Erythrobacter sp. EC-HK427]VVT09466.1 conserved hypothetical protein [Erythrobacter sp. EC-HK427]
MLHLIPAPLHRLGLQWAHRVRRQFRKIVRPDLFGVAVLLRDEAGRVLLVRHSYGPDGWALPGGGIGRHDDPAEGARREMREELGCELQELALLRTFSEAISGAAHTGHLFTARPAREPVVDGRELAEARWFVVEELAAARLTRVTRERLAAVGLL